MRSRQHIRLTIERVKARVKTNDTVTGLVWLLAAVIVYLMAIIVVDQASPLERAVRLNLLWILAAVAVLGLAGVLLLPTLRRVNDLYAARLIEQQAEDLFRNSLVSFVQLSDDGGVDPGIVDAVSAKAARDLKSVDLEMVVNRRPMRWASVALGAALALLVVFAATTPKSFGTSLGRAMGLEIAPPTATRILQVRPESPATITAGDDVAISADVAGEGPHGVEIRMTRDGTYWDTLAMVDRGAGRWELTVAAVQREMRFRVRAGDARSDEHRVTVLPLPAVTRVRTRLTYPSYTMLAPATHDTGNVDAPAATRVEVVAETNVASRRPPELLWGDGERKLLLRPVAGTQEARGTFTVTADDTYAIHFSDSASGRSNVGAIRYRVKVVPDRPPVVEISGPGATVSVAADGAVALGVRAGDDYGLDRLTLGWRRETAGPDRGREQSQVLRTMPGDRAVLLVTERFTVRPADLGLTAGDEASVWFAATDRLPAGAQEGRSEEIRLVVTEPDGGGENQADGGAGTGDGQSADATGQRDDGAGGADQPELTDQQRQDLEKMRQTLEELRQAMADDGGADSGQPSQAAPSDDGSAEARPGDGQTGGQRPDPGAGEQTSQNQDPATAGGPATDVNQDPTGRPKDADVGERRTDFTETGSPGEQGPADAQLLRTVGAQVQRLEQQLRDGTVDPKLIKDLGWTEAELQRFVSRYEDRYGTLAAKAAGSRVTRDATALPPGDITAAEGASGTVGGGSASGDPGASDDLGDNVEVRARRAGSPFARLVNEYVRAVSEAETPRD